MGKGSKRRPAMVDEDKVKSNWDRVFAKKDNNTIESLSELLFLYLVAEAISEEVEIERLQGTINAECAKKDDAIH